MDLEKYAGKLRILLIETPSYKDNKYIVAKETYFKNEYEFHKRFVKLITKISDEFAILLIGFDGEVKKKYKKINPSRIFKHIEQMPMGHLINKKKFKPTNLSLYSDYNPKKTVKGLGFKNKEKAIKTLEIIKDKPLKYQKNVVNTMLNRAKYHPHKTKEMKEAIKVFEKWLKKNQINGGGQNYFASYKENKKRYLLIKYYL